MTEKRIIYTNAEGGMSVVVPAPNSGLTIEQVAAKDVPAGVTYFIVDADTVPADRTFRNAWKNQNAQVNVDMPKAKEIAHERRRAKRAQEFAPLDVEATIPAKAQQAEAAREAIRQKYAAMQSAIDSASTVEELKTVAAEVL